MAQHEIETQWMGKMQFNSLVNGHTVIMDAPERVGGEDQGPHPETFCAFGIIWVYRNGHRFNTEEI